MSCCTTYTSSTVFDNIIPIIAYLVLWCHYCLELSLSSHVDWKYTLGKHKYWNAHDQVEIMRITDLVRYYLCCADTDSTQQVSDTATQIQHLIWCVIVYFWVYVTCLLCVWHDTTWHGFLECLILGYYSYEDPLETLVGVYWLFGMSIDGSWHYTVLV